MAERTRAKGLVPIEQVTVAQARAGYNARYRERSLPPEGEVLVERLSIPGPGGAINARLYRPRELASRTPPLIVYFHGGGFVLGDADAYELQSMRLAELAGCAVLFPEYRLAPEHRFPAAVDDACAIVDWVATQAGRVGFDPARLVVAGDSAGGNLCANITLRARDRGLPRIALQCLLYPVTDLRPYCGGPSYHSIDAYSEGYLLDRNVMEWFVRGYLQRPDQAGDLRASPILAGDLSSLPPTVIITAEYDPLRDMGAEFGNLLAAAGTSIEYHCMAGLAHNFMGHVAESAAARRAFVEVASILRRRLEETGAAPARVAGRE